AVPKRSRRLSAPGEWCRSLVGPQGDGATPPPRATLGEAAGRRRNVSTSTAPRTPAACRCPPCGRTGRGALTTCPYRVWLRCPEPSTKTPCRLMRPLLPLPSLWLPEAPVWLALQLPGERWLWRAC